MSDNTQIERLESALTAFQRVYFDTLDLAGIDHPGRVASLAAADKAIDTLYSAIECVRTAAKNPGALDDVGPSVTATGPNPLLWPTSSGQPALQAILLRQKGRAASDRRRRLASLQGKRVDTARLRESGLLPAKRRVLSSREYLRLLDDMLTAET
ncbi:MAG: hypothetical protein E6R03_00325 [Hyphomicrobiaceae bacterium]|nr:MAG: hypothetical protein E6R03_00325 [Hyphomicrobiaceae bacterium]